MGPLGLFCGEIVLLLSPSLASPFPVFSPLFAENTQRKRGTASKWNDKGFCFLKPDDGGDEVFCHSSGIKDGNCIREGAVVEFDNTFDERKGKPRAENVTGGFYEDRRAPRDSTSATRSRLDSFLYRLRNRCFEFDVCDFRVVFRLTLYVCVCLCVYVCVLSICIFLLADGPCYGWRDGTCTRGSSCKFSHDDGGRRDRYDDRRDRYDDRRGGYDDRRDRYDDRRYERRDSRDRYDDRRDRGYDDRRYDDRR